MTIPFVGLIVIPASTGDEASRKANAKASKTLNLDAARLDLELSKLSPQSGLSASVLLDRVIYYGWKSLKRKLRGAIEPRGSLYY
jgi:hypothetical protein